MTHSDLILTGNYRALADADNRGKLNLAEFHVAMGLIYRRMFDLHHSRV